MPEHREIENFITTPLEFFGHSSDDIYFGYPQEYYDQLEESAMMSAEYIQTLEQDRERLLANQPPVRHRYDIADTNKAVELLDADLSYAKRRITQDVNHEWYERRFRGRYPSHVPEGVFPDVEAFADAYFYKQDDEAAAELIPPTQQITGYLNEKIRLNEWRGAALTAKAWHDMLPENHPDKQVASDYFGFSGNIILHEYAHIAIKLAEASTADDDFVSFKHLVTVCWPMADALEAYIPEEVARTKQILREAFLQMASRGSSSIRSYVDMFAGDSLGISRHDFYENDEQRQKGYRALLGFEHGQQADRQAMYLRVLEKAQDLAEAERWGWAMDLLDIARYSFGLTDAPEIQEQIDDYAMQAAEHYLRDMAEFKQPWAMKIGKYEHPTCNMYEINQITGEAYISDDIRQRIIDMKISRSIEYEIQQIHKTHEPTHQQLWELLDQLTEAGKETAAHYANEDVRTWLKDLLLGGATDKLDGQGMDHALSSAIKLKNFGVFSFDDMELVLLTLKDKVLDRAIIGTSSAFDAFIGWVSPIMRGTDKPETGNPDDEAVWKFLSKKEFTLFMERLSTLRGFANREDAAWYDQQLTEFTTDFRSAWDAYWTERDTY